MPYEVIKRVGKRAYRYRVESYRDPESGRSKGRWTYLGRYHEPLETEERKLAEQQENATRDRLLNAFEELLRETSFDEVTIDAIVTCANVSHATFYRHFKNKRAMLIAAIERVKDELNPTSVLRVTSSDVAGERKKLRQFFHQILNRGIASGLVRALLEARFYDPMVHAFWDAFLKLRVQMWSRYIAELNEHGMGHGDDPQRLSALLMMFGQGTISEISLHRGKLTEQDADALADMFGRIVFRGN